MEERYQLLLAMTHKERLLSFIEEDGREARSELEGLINELQFISHEIEVVKRIAKLALIEYNEDNDEESLERLELNTDMLKTFTEYRHHLREHIKEARDRVRWLRMEYKRAMS